MTDAGYMRLALAQARKGLGNTYPNPAVGAVVVRGGRVVGRGFHRYAGAAHGEAAAIKAAGSLARGATLYVTLEPCNHQGRTPPCTESVLRAGVRRVVIGSMDPNPQVAGGGAQRLRDAGLDVVTGVLADECDGLLAGFRKFITSGRPWVTLKLAATLDGRIATDSGDSKWITNERSRRFVHQLRGDHDAILVGAETVIADDPELTCRLAGRLSPRRVILDGRLRIPLTARALLPSVGPRGELLPSIVVTSQSAPPRKLARLQAAGVLVLALPAVKARVAPARVLAALGKLGLTSVLIEGGGGVAAAFLKARAIDQAMLFYAPKLVGSTGRAMIGELGVRRMRDALVLPTPQVRRFGEDFLVSSTLNGGIPFAR